MELQVIIVGLMILPFAMGAFGLLLLFNKTRPAAKVVAKLFLAYLVVCAALLFCGKYYRMWAADRRISSYQPVIAALERYKETYGSFPLALPSYVPEVIPESPPFDAGCETRETRAGKKCHPVPEYFVDGPTYWLVFSPGEPGLVPHYLVYTPSEDYSAGVFEIGTRYLISLRQFRSWAWCYRM